MSDAYVPWYIAWAIRTGKDSAELMFKALRRAKKRPEFVLPYIDDEAARECLAKAYIEEKLIANIKYIRGELEAPAIFLEYLKAFALSKEKKLHLKVPEWEPPVVKG